MIRHVHLDPRINKSLELLRRSGKKAALAAARAEKIIQRMRQGHLVPDRIGTITKHGELRIKGVMKYNLGAGYRLITFKTGRRLFLLHVGTHDDCHRWIENNRELTEEQIRERCNEMCICPAELDPSPHPETTAHPDEDIDPLSNATERDLRKVFRGLVSASQS
ncbi:hypothetical protein [Desulfatitalea tepidiphila]|uniref:hypothetical protein n=1 Tax=Desulfatitalea tepidiphila TaxID=1185843 RepID=UPI0006B4CE6E|nr:hypothetical protein [Desulfatitalea tepidiphila]